MGYKWSALNNSFFHTSDIDEYKYAGWDLSDIVDIGIDYFSEFTSPPPFGKMRGVSSDGAPCWVDTPPPSQSELVSQAEARKVQLAAAAEQSIRPLERAKQLGIVTDKELTVLTEWERYSVFLMRVDTSKAPDINWPTVPTV